jgi:hypothetical protein
MNVRLKYNMNFTAGLYYGGEMRMNSYQVTLSMITNSTDAVSHNVAFERIKYFVYNCLDSSIFVNATETDVCKNIVNAGFNVSTLPGDPVDQLIGLMLYYKLNAIMEDRIVVEETEISSTLGENMIYMHCENENTDIGVMPDWWTSSDPMHSEYMAVDANNIVNIQSNVFWKELDLLWPDSKQQHETGNIVVFADFKSDNDSK